MAIPYTFKKVGCILGLILFLICGWVSYFTLDLLVKVSNESKIINLIELINFHFGYETKLVSEIAQFIGIFGTIVLYIQISNYFNLNIIVSNFVFSFLFSFGLDHSYYNDNAKLIQITFFLIFTLVPLVLISDISILERLSAFGTISLLYVVFVNIILFNYLIVR